MIKEEWRDIEGYEGMYQVSNLGNVRGLNRVDSTGRKRKERILKPKVTSSGYHQAGLCKNSKVTNHLIHRLVAVAFIDNPDNKKTVNHKDGCKSNNKLMNLEWLTASENNKHAFSVGLKSAKGSKNSQSKFTEEDIPVIFRLYRQGLSQKKIADKFNVQQQSISKILNRQRFAHVKI